jgi:Multicopper oxidase
MFGMRSIWGRHQRAPDREFEVVFTPFGQFMTIDGRAGVGNTGTWLYHCHVETHMDSRMIGTYRAGMNMSDRNHTVTADDGSFDSGVLVDGALRRHLARAQFRVRGPALARVELVDRDGWTPRIVGAPLRIGPPRR